MWLELTDERETLLDELLKMGVSEDIWREDRIDGIKYVEFVAAAVEFCCTNRWVDVAVALDTVVRFDVRIGELEDCSEAVEFEVTFVELGCKDTGLNVALVLDAVVEFDVKIIELEDVKLETASVEFICKDTVPEVTAALGIMVKDGDEEEFDTVLVAQTAESATITVDMMVPVLVKTVLVEVEEAIAEVAVASAVA